MNLLHWYRAMQASRLLDDRSRSAQRRVQGDEFEAQERVDAALSDARSLPWEVAPARTREEVMERIQMLREQKLHEARQSRRPRRSLWMLAGQRGRRLRQDPRVGQRAGQYAGEQLAGKRPYPSRALGPVIAFVGVMCILLVASNPAAVERGAATTYGWARAQAFSVGAALGLAARSSSSHAAAEVAANEREQVGAISAAEGSLQDQAEAIREDTARAAAAVLQRFMPDAP